MDQVVLCHLQYLVDLSFILKNSLTKSFGHYPVWSFFKKYLKTKSQHSALVGGVLSVLTFGIMSVLLCLFLFVFVFIFIHSFRFLFTYMLIFFFTKLPIFRYQSRKVKE